MKRENPADSPAVVHREGRGGRVRVCVGVGRAGDCGRLVQMESMPLPVIFCQ